MKEIKFIEQIKKMAAEVEKGKLKAGIGDDAAAIEISKDRYLLLSTDTVTEGVHFPEKPGRYERIGYKAASVALSDIVACGGKAEYILTDIVFPEKTGEKARISLFRGLLNGAKKCDARIIGGDTVGGKALTVSVTAVGFSKARDFISRSTAKENDLIFITGPVRDGKKEHMSFRVRFKEAQELTGRIRVNSMIDTSDGIVPDILRICDQSRTGCEIWPGSVPLSEGLSLNEALYYGESFELLFTVSEKEAGKLLDHMKKKNAPPDYYLIGRMLKKEKGRFLRYETGKKKMKYEGYRHF